MLAKAEFLAVDTETNGLPGEECELTEVGAVLVGGGELHEEWESLVRTARPLGRGIQRFTGISQGMVDAAPEPRVVLEQLAARMEGRVLVAHSASFDKRVLHQAFERAGVSWPDPDVLCTVALARRFAPLARQRKLAPLAGALGIDVEGTHRALVDARTCARVFCALFPRLCAAAPTLEQAMALAAPGRSKKRRAAKVRKRPPAERPDLSRLPEDPGVYIFRDEGGRPLYVGKSVSLRSRARSHFCAPAGWTERAEVVDYRPTRSELGALVLENRLIKQWRPPGNVKLKRTDGYVYVRCRLDIEYPVLDVAAEPASGRAVNIGPVKGRATARELADQLSSLFGLRHCGRALRRRDHPSIYGQMDRCVSPCLGDLDPNAYRRRLDEALGLFDSAGDAAARLIAHVEEHMHEASEDRRYERAAALRSRRDRLAGLLGRLDGVLEATDRRTRLVLASHPAKPEWEAFWIAGGRVADWGPVPGVREIRERSERAAEVRKGLLSPEEVDEVRIVSSWLARNDALELDLSGAPTEAAIRRFLPSGAQAA
ncbi:MAG: 3'-5' exoribonuclease [Thermoleophilaceae bacterium]|nr:3'-5' exoribonuclease [Thermoleophilaceae bacterium]